MGAAVPNVGGGAGAAGGAGASNSDTALAAFQQAIDQANATSLKELTMDTGFQETQASYKKGDDAINKVTQQV